MKRPTRLHRELTPPSRTTRKLAAAGLLGGDYLAQMPPRRCRCGHRLSAHVLPGPCGAKKCPCGEFVEDERFLPLPEPVRLASGRGSLSLVGSEDGVDRYSLRRTGTGETGEGVPDV